ncbi:hypothetical protein [Hoeflea sp.]|uniref:hypothetical protein n=1 Tax=Hoeflea sp. TaxID=1940281 RepID=UPI003B521B31
MASSRLADPDKPVRWRAHVLIVGLFLVLAVPVVLLDRMVARGQEGTFGVDFTGAFIRLYLIWTLLQVLCTTLLVWFFRMVHPLILHLAVACFVTLLTIGISQDIERRRALNAHEARLARIEAREPYAGLVNLSGWDYSTDADGNPVLDIRFDLGASGHMGVSVRGFDRDMKLIFAARIPESETFSPAGRHFLRIPLDVAETAEPGEVADVLDITLHLDKGKSGTAPFDISKEYMTGSKKRSDSVFFYAPLPPRGMPGDQ